MGYLGIDFELLYSLNWISLLNVIKGKQQRITDLRKDEWEQVRMLGFFMVSPYAKKKMNPEQLLKLPWDKESDTKGTVEKSNEKAVDRLAELLGGM